MPVIINEFEVIAESAQPPAAAPAAAAGDKPKPKLEPVQLAAPLERLHEQSLRVWVH